MKMVKHIKPGGVGKKIDVVCPSITLKDLRKTYGEWRWSSTHS